MGRANDLCCFGMHLAICKRGDPLCPLMIPKCPGVTKKDKVACHTVDGEPLEL